MVPGVEIVDRMPTVAEHRALFEAQGWSWYGEETVRRSLAGSLHGLVAMVSPRT